MASSFSVNFNGSKATNIKQYEYSQSNLIHNASQTNMQTNNEEIDYGKTDSFDYERYLEQNTNVVETQIPVIDQETIEQLKETLRGYGFVESDIERLLNGQITIDGLYQEIQKDSNASRRQKIYESNYLVSLGSEYKSVNDLEAGIKANQKEIERLRREQGEFNFSEEEAIMGILNGLIMYGGDLDEIIDTYIVGWEYTDENGVKQYDYCYNPYYIGGYYGSKPIYYKDVYGDSKYIEEIRNSLVETTKTRGILFWQEEYTVYEWQNTEEQVAILEEIEAKSSAAIDKREKSTEEYQSKIDELTIKVAQDEALLEYINNELEHYMLNVDAYIYKEDFLEKCGINSEMMEKANSLGALDYTNYNEHSLPIKYINTKEDVVAVIGAVINGSENYTASDSGIYANGIVSISSSNEMLKNYDSWARYVSEEERQVFNYIYNKEGVDAAYEYLESISNELDNRWLMDRQQKDAEWAKEHPVLASAASIVVTPFEGINAAFNSLGSVMTGEEIRRVNVYSSGDVFRQAVSQDIYENYGEGWAFAYNTGMSMADSGVLIAGSIATGGALGAAGVTSSGVITATNTVISATTMGSRAYVSTLNDALDRGLSDGKAVGLAFSSATVETLMESYSVGHLINLEGKLGEGTLSLLQKATSKIANPTLQKIAFNSGYFALGAISQGICEGEEEFCTEIANHYLDEMISGDLSSYNLAIKNYIVAGNSEIEARRLATLDYYGQVEQAFLGGFASGCLFGAGKIGINEFNTSRRVAQSIKAEYKVSGIEGIDQNTRKAIVASIIGINSKYQDACIVAITGNMTEEVFAGLDGKTRGAIEQSLYNYNRYFAAFNSDNVFEKTENINDIEKQMRITEEFLSENEKMNFNSNQQISDLLKNSNDFSNILKYVLGLEDGNVPEGFSSVAEYKLAFINELIFSGKINEISNGNLFSLLQDPVMLPKLIGCEKLNDLFVKNLDRLYGTILPIFSELSEQQWNILFSNETMKSYFGSLDSKTLGKIFSSFNENFQTSWLAIDGIVEIVENMEVLDFYEFLNSIGYKKENLAKSLQSKNALENYNKILDTIINKYFTFDVALKNSDYRNLIDRILIDSYLFRSFEGENVEAVKSKIKTIEQLKRECVNTLNNSIRQKSEIQLEETFGSLEIPVDDTYKYYDLIYEMDGVEYTKQYVLYGNQISLFNILTDDSMIDSIVRGQFILKRVVPNIVKSTLVLTEQNGVQNGLNEIILLVDGKEERIVKKMEYDSIDLSSNFPNAKSVEIKLVKPLGSLNVEISDKNAIYRVLYEINGVQKESFQTVSKKLAFSNIAENILELDKFVEQNNLLGVKILDVSIVSASEIKSAFPQISKYDASESIYLQSKYGGNQSDVRTIVQDFLEGKVLSEIEVQKAGILLSLIDRYFSNATDIEKINLATIYEQGGCAYMAVANAFATYMGSIENGERLFKERFGYDLVIRDNGSISYNVEGIAFDICLRNLSKEYSGDIHQIDFKNVNNISVGISALAFDSIVGEYFKEHNIELESDSMMHAEGNNLKNDLLAMVLDSQDSFHILSASMFDIDMIGGGELESGSLDGALANSKKEDSVMSGVGGHAMLITGLDESLDLIVSSWSSQYKFLSESVVNYKANGKSSRATVWNIKFSIPK